MLPQPQLQRVLGPWMATAVVVGTIIGSGVFVKGKQVAQNVPEFALALSVWVLGGILALVGSLAIAEVAVLYPKAGGSYVYLREAYGRWAGFLWGWVDFWIIRAASIAALATMFTTSFHDILRQTLSPTGTEVLSVWARLAFTIAVIAALTWLNARGTRLGGGVQVAITSVKVATLLFIIALPFVILALVNAPAHPPSVANLRPIIPAEPAAIDWGRYGAALVGVLWAYHGWLNITPVAEEVRDPNRNIPLALIVGVLGLIALYCGANAAYAFVIPATEMAQLRSPVSTEFCLRLLGSTGGVIASAMLLISVFGALNGNLLVGPRLLFAMGRDGLAPRILGQLHRTYNTPAAAGLVLSLWACTMLVAVALLTEFRLPLITLGGRTIDPNLPPDKIPFDVITDFCIFGAVVFETLSVASIFVFRWKVPATVENRPYRCWGYPFTPLVYVLIMAAVLANMFATPHQRAEAVVGGVFISLGAILYVTVIRRRLTTH